MTRFLTSAAALSCLPLLALIAPCQSNLGLQTTPGNSVVTTPNPAGGFTTIFVPAQTFFGATQGFSTGVSANRDATIFFGVTSPTGASNSTSMTSHAFTDSIGATALGRTTAASQSVGVVPTAATPVGGQLRITVNATSSNPIATVATASATWTGGSVSATVPPSGSTFVAVSNNNVIDYSAAVASSLTINSDARVLPGGVAYAFGQVSLEYFRFNSAAGGFGGCVGTLDFSPVSTTVTASGIDEVHRFTITGGIPNAPAAMFVSASSATLPGPMGCDFLNTSLSVGFPTLDASGNGSVDITYPSTFSGTLYVQAFYATTSVGTSNVLVISG